MEKEIRWNEEKNEWLRHTRGICFDDISRGDHLDTIEHPTLSHQHMLIVAID
jgi:hypothetical protein